MQEIPHQEHDTRITPTKETPIIGAIVAVGLLFALLVVVSHLGTLAAETTPSTILIGMMIVSAGSVAFVAIITRWRHGR